MGSRAPPSDFGIDGRIERHLGAPAGKALLHLDDVFFADVEFFGEEFGPGEQALGLETLFLAHQMVEELLLRLGRARL